MPTTTPTTPDTAAPPVARSRAATITLWVLQVLLAINIAFAGVGKLTGMQAMVDMFDSIGVGQWFRYVTGALEVAGAIGLLIPRLTGLAALGLVGVMIGAIATHLFIIGGSPVLPIVLLIVAAIIAWGRRDSTLALLGSLRRSS